eukprot:6188702-Pleurochrysis_carterae.AAC.1
MRCGIKRTGRRGAAEWRRPTAIFPRNASVQRLIRLHHENDCQLPARWEWQGEALPFCLDFKYH